MPAEGGGKGDDQVKDSQSAALLGYGDTGHGMAGTWPGIHSGKHSDDHVTRHTDRDTNTSSLLLLMDDDDTAFFNKFIEKKSYLTADRLDCLVDGSFCLIAILSYNANFSVSNQHAERRVSVLTIHAMFGAVLLSLTKQAFVGARHSSSQQPPAAAAVDILRPVLPYSTPFLPARSLAHTQRPCPLLRRVVYN